MIHLINGPVFICLSSMVCIVLHSNNLFYFVYLISVFLLTPATVFLGVLMNFLPV